MLTVAAVVVVASKVPLLARRFGPAEPSSILAEFGLLAPLPAEGTTASTWWMQRPAEQQRQAMSRAMAGPGALMSGHGGGA